MRILKILAALLFLVLSTAEAGCGDRPAPTAWEDAGVSHPGTGMQLSPQGGNVAVNLSGCSATNVVAWNGTAFACSAGGGGITNTAGSNVIPLSAGSGSGLVGSPISIFSGGSAVQVGPINIATADFSIGDGRPSSQALLWIQSDDIHHVGSAGNNEQIGIVIRNNSTFNVTASTANSTGIDVIVAGSADTGSNVLTVTALAPNATCTSCNGGAAYAYNSQFGIMKNAGSVAFGPGDVSLGNNVDSFELPGSTSVVARIGIGGLPSVDGTAIETKNTITTSTFSGIDVGLDTTVNAGIRGGYFMYRGASGGFSGNSSGMVLAAAPGFPFTDSAANEVSLYSELGAPIRIGADSSGFTSAMEIDVNNVVQILRGVLNMNSHQINNVTDPTSAQDAATKNYVNTTPSIGGTYRNPPAALLAATGSIANTETQVVVMTIPANTIVAGASFRVRAVGTTNGGTGGTSVMDIRLGPTTLTGPIVATVSKAEVSTSTSRWFEGIVTIRSIGASGTAVGTLEWLGGDGGGYDLTQRNAITSPVTIDTTVINLLEITYISGNSGVSIVFSQALLEQVF